MAPTECLLSAFVLACWRACWPGCLPACLLILNNITHTRTDGCTHKIPSSRAPVGAKKYRVGAFTLGKKFKFQAQFDDKEWVF